ncbi:PREDICTED: uncharacterized protein LOC104709216 [Camelina sativa]|uniref:Uncharacterized protein LOC104709216 n=1 Tax=Camelina sativa TaxID=90675 RepID=A0ABM0TCG2_CAMSA|nr:PREDICTED: uncharacterized protein LOC104709216 [Camelina sativa]
MNQASKPEADWTDEEQKRSKYNSRALSAIHCSVGKKQFELIQGCETAKEAWDILQIQYEGTTKVQSSRKDMLASRFENLRMEEHESISDFSSKLSALAQEALTLGKTYKDQKLVKKFLRCLPSRFMGYKTALFVSHDLDSLNYGEVVGMLQAHEMELNGIKKPKGIALAVSKDVTNQGEEDIVSLLVRRFDRALRRIEQGKCHECKGFGHFIRECPTIRLRDAKCTICKGTGHTHDDCVGNSKGRKEKSMISIEDDSDNDSSSEEELINLAAMVGITEFENGEEVTDSESEGEEVLDIVQNYKEVRETLIALGKENQGLIKEKLRLEALVIALQNELVDEKKIAKDSLDLMKEKLVLSAKADKLEEELCTEKKKSSELQSELDQQHRKIHMFAGTKQLDKILSYGRTEKTHRGLGFTENREAKQKTTKFVFAGTHNVGNEVSIAASNKPFSCYFCGKIGHYKRYCYKFWAKVNNLRHQGRFLWNGVRRQIWMKKADLYQSGSTVASGSGFRCNMAMITEEQEDFEPWFFDSGCSRHMTGTKSNLQNIKKLKGGTITFGDGSHGFIQGKEIIRGVPKLKGEENMVCGPCNQGKQVKIQPKKVPDVQSKSFLDLIHMDLMGPMQVESLAGKKYVFVLVDDYSRYTWVRFIREKSDIVDSFKILALQLLNE